MNASEPSIGYYCGEAVELLTDHGDGWISTRFVADRKGKIWRMWRTQVKTSPWGDEPV